MPRCNANPVVECAASLTEAQCNAAFVPLDTSLGLNCVFNQVFQECFIRAEECSTGNVKEKKREGEK